MPRRTVSSGSFIRRIVAEADAVTAFGVEDVHTGVVNYASTRGRA